MCPLPIRGPSCFFAAKEVFVTGGMLAAEAVCIGDGRLAVAAVTCGFQVPPPLHRTMYDPLTFEYTNIENNIPTINDLLLSEIK